MSKRICVICGKEFGKPKLWHSKAKTCGKECSKIYEKEVKKRYKINNPDKVKKSHKKWYNKKPRKLIKRICKICKREFIIKYPRDLTCSKECRKKNVNLNGKRNSKIWVKKHPKQRKKICQNYSIKNREILRIKANNWRKKNPEKARINVKKWRKKYPKKRNAQALAQNSIKITKGKLCEICNLNLAKHRHHKDYSKPKEVKFLCVRCHVSIHNKPKMAI